MQSNLSMYKTTEESPHQNQPISGRTKISIKRSKNNLIANTFGAMNENSRILNSRNSLPVNQAKYTGRLKLDKKLQRYIKETDDFLNLYTKSNKQFLTIIQAPITVSSNACVNVNQSIVLPQNKNKRKQLDFLFDQYKLMKRSHDLQSKLQRKNSNV